MTPVSCLECKEREEQYNQTDLRFTGDHLCAGIRKQTEENMNAPIRNTAGAKTFSKNQQKAQQAHKPWFTFLWPIQCISENQYRLLIVLWEEEASTILRCMGDCKWITDVPNYTDCLIADLDRVSHLLLFSAGVTSLRAEGGGGGLGGIK